MPVWIVIASVILYLTALFYVAWRQDKRATQDDFKQNPIVFSLALCVYFTSWTFFGAVGTAASSGWDYLPIYIGPFLVFLFLPGLIKRMGDVTEREGVTSISDFLSARYGKSRSVGVAVAVAAVMGSLPYIALQLKSVGMSTEVLLGLGPGEQSRANVDPVLITAISLTGFAIIFGTRHSDLTKNNAGLMHVLAIEALVKIAALIAVAALSIWLLQDEVGSVEWQAPAVFQNVDPSARFITLVLISMAAIICLPRQFHVTFVERQTDQDQRTARWLFPLYLFVTCLVVVPIAMAGLHLFPDASTADLYVLQIPLFAENGFLALLVFLGGFSAATGMVIVAMIALSNMVANEVIIPFLMRSGQLGQSNAYVGRRVLVIRRFVIAAIMLLSYGYYRLDVSSEALAQIGLLSFAAAAQFAPAVIAALYWRGARERGAFFGILIGMLVWAYTLFIPTLSGDSFQSANIPGFLNPHALLGISFGDPLVHGVFWSLLLNTIVLIIGSVQTPERLRDRVQAAAFVGKVGGVSENTLPKQAFQSVTPDGLKALAARFLTGQAVEHAFEKFSDELGVTVSGDKPADWRLVQRTERLLANALGSSSARVIMTSAIGGSQVELDDVLTILDQRTLAERFDQNMLQAMLENIDQGISVVDHEQRLVAWNGAYVDLFSYPHDLVQVGTPIADLIKHNIQSGWIGGDPAIQAERRIRHMRIGKPHMYERQNPDGRYLRITGNPMPGGGYVSLFSDITEDKQREHALIEANEMLEHRVKKRTTEIRSLADRLEISRAEAEAANASKTRFLAAASHDLLQPLNAARLFLGALDTKGDAKATDLLNKTDRAIRSADELLKGLLDISRLDHSMVHPNSRNLQLAPLLEDIADEARPMASRVGLDLRVAPTRLAVVADPDFLSSILRNFVSNARRYTEEGGILIGARRQGTEMVRIEVWDTGPGIPEEEHDKLFEEFTRLKEEDNSGVRGAGLGLAVAQRMAQLMGTSIALRSTLGRGSVFSVTLPKSEASPERKVREHHACEHVSKSLSGLRILCVDDETSILEGMRALLEKWGCIVYIASNLDAARQIAAQFQFDVLFVDYQLNNGETGLTLINELRNQLTSSDNVAVLTAKADELLDEEKISSELDIIRKPVDVKLIEAFLVRCKS